MDAAHTMKLPRLSQLVTFCNAQLSIGKRGISMARILHSPLGNRPINPPIVDRQTVLIRMSDPIRNADPPARNDQDALYDKGFRWIGQERSEWLI
jgi:hypothetical protein